MTVIADPQGVRREQVRAGEQGPRPL